MKKKSLNIADLSVYEMPEILQETAQKLNVAYHELDDSNRRLKELNESITEADKRRKRFYANISHDLRAPITAISNITEYLLSQYQEDTEDNNGTKRMLQIMQSRIDYLKRMINDVFLLSSLDSTEDTLHKEAVDMGFFLEDYFYMCEVDAAYEKADLHLEVDESLDCIMEIDPHLMQRVLDNLFTNALKYSGEHPVIILGAYEDKSADQLIIYVEDHGNGIASDQLDNIFEWSSRGDTARTPTETAGSGFGLSIVKMIVERHHGTISCSSVPGEQTRFTIRLPIHDEKHS